MWRRSTFFFSPDCYVAKFPTVIHITFLYIEILKYPNVSLMVSFLEFLEKLQKGPVSMPIYGSIKGTRQINRWLQHRML